MKHNQKYILSCIGIHFQGISTFCLIKMVNVIDSLTNIFFNNFITYIKYMTLTYFCLQSVKPNSTNIISKAKDLNEVHSLIRIGN